MTTPRKRAPRKTAATKAATVAPQQYSNPALDGAVEPASEPPAPTVAPRLYSAEDAAPLTVYAVNGELTTRLTVGTCGTRVAAKGTRLGKRAADFLNSRED